MSMDAIPFFSIIIPTYNRADIISRTIESVLNQKFIDFELIVVDDGGTDNTGEVINSFHDKRIHYYWKDNEERGAARNYGASKAKGKYLNFFDSDDVMYADHLEIAYNFIKKTVGPEVIHLAFDIVDEELNQMDSLNSLPDPINPLLIKGNVLSCDGVFIRADIFNENKFIEDRKLAASEDYELWLRLGGKFDIRSSQEVTSGIVQHNGRSVINIDEDVFLGRMSLLIDHISDTHKEGNFKGSVAEMRSNIFLYSALHMAMAGYRGNSIRQLFKAYREQPKYMFSRKTLGVIKNLIF